ncbi:hypothetical protein EJ357_26615 [Streptomyces cyaneochromogenes]|uniref:Uncharacterized protein n=2 Tax=Streptomyces cyaneochromogenes TaxID=2496836 RepID=A0A3Q9F1P3_9ACTN|nr:hypothetical protein EJ357_26615 [Streptomyces cyaneochromogenes]
MRVAAVCGAALMAAVGGMVPQAGAAGGAEEGLAYHGSVLLSGGLADVRFAPHRSKPDAAAGAKVTVRLRWSVPLADRQALPRGCVRAEPRVLMCRIGAPDADGVGQQVGLRVRLQGAPSEVLVDFDTLQSGGQADDQTGGQSGEQGGEQTGRQRVLALDTGDTYYF